ncbi:MAG: calcium/sodium antiporter [Tenericutes bacterium]|nr:calcium/sodium antiporter [Mycoplasmatota bacterium]
MLKYIFLLIGFIVIIKASDILVDSATSIAIKCKVPKMLIALTIVSFGTCAPEIAISFTSVINKNGTIAFANVIGSCIVNVFLIIGLASLLHPIKVKHDTVKKELPILLLITTSFSALMLDSGFNKTTPNVFSRVDGIVLMSLFLMFVLYLIQLSKRREKNNEKMEIKYDNIWIAIIILILSIVLISLSSNIIVDNAIKIAKSLHISEKLITMTAIVIGTSLPEMFMTISSARKGEFDMAIGNIIGTNIFNICIVLGLPVTIYGDISLSNFSIIDIVAVFLTSLDLYLFARSERTISKLEGFIMLLIFAVYYVSIIFF